jgi:hypothetical protein
MTDQDDITLGEVGRAVKRIEDSIKELRKDFGEQFVTQNEFRPVARIVYGLTGLMLLAVIGALLRLAVR